MTAEQYARMLKALLPSGKVWRLEQGGELSNLFLGCGDELERVDGRVAELLAESDPRTADELLADFERVLGLESDGTTPQRRLRVVAALLRRPRFRPVDFQTALAPLYDVDPEDVTVIERTAAEAASMGDPREIYRFFITCAAPGPDAVGFAEVQEVIDLMKPSHTLGQVITSLNFLCDDPNSLCDADTLGV